jgi:hypothetical protein
VEARFGAGDAVPRDAAVAFERAPLHLAAEGPAAVEVLRVLLERDRPASAAMARAVSSQDSLGRTPLHAVLAGAVPGARRAAAAAGAPPPPPPPGGGRGDGGDGPDGDAALVEAMEELLEHDRLGTLSHRDGRGRLPLHVACATRAGPRAGAVRLLCKVPPAGARAPPVYRPPTSMRTLAAISAAPSTPLFSVRQMFAVGPRAPHRSRTGLDASAGRDLRLRRAEHVRVFAAHTCMFHACVLCAERIHRHAILLVAGRWIYARANIYQQPAAAQGAL